MAVYPAQSLKLHRQLLSLLEQPHPEFKVCGGGSTPHNFDLLEHVSCATPPPQNSASFVQAPCDKGLAVAPPMISRASSSVSSVAEK